MIIECQEIYSRFLLKITNYDYLEMDTNDIYKHMFQYLSSTVSIPYVRRIFSSLIIDSESLKLKAELKNCVDKDNTESDKNFILEVLSIGMVSQWLEPRVKSTINISQMFTGKEQKFYSQATHLSELRGLLDDTKIELRKMIRDHAYINNDYIGD